MKIPIIINNRDLLTWPKAMVEKVKTYDNAGDIIIVDNGSTYQPLLDWYKTKPCEIVYCKNLGHNGPWYSGVIKRLNSEHYVVSDPDLGLDETPVDTLTYLSEKMDHFKLDKVGLGLDWKSICKNSSIYKYLIEYETARWANSRIEHNVYLDIHIDTTFALYRTRRHFVGGASTGYPYIAKHFPWYMTDEERESNWEFMFYLTNATSSSSFKTNLGLLSQEPAWKRLLKKLSIIFGDISR